jgi:hypothetical protein
MSRYVFSYYDGDELVLYRESQTPDDPESDMPYLGFYKECTEAIVEYKKTHPNAKGHGQIADNVTDGIVKRWNS